MPVKINIGVCKKIGLPDYGSAGSHCNVEIETDFSVMNNPDEFQNRVRNAYRLCRDAVEAELAAHRRSENGKRDTRPSTPPKTEYRDIPPEHGENPFPASEKQMEFIARLAKGIKGLTNQKLNEYCMSAFGKASSRLSSHDASKLIDALKNAKAGKELA